MATLSASTTSRPLSLDAEKERKANAKVTTNVAYKRGDLLTLSSSNVLTHAADASTWSVICCFDMTQAESTTAASNGTEIPVWTGGVFNIAAVSISGTALATNQYAAARAKATLNRIELAEI